MFSRMYLSIKLIAGAAGGSVIVEAQYDMKYLMQNNSRVNCEIHVDAVPLRCYVG